MEKLTAFLTGTTEALSEPCWSMTSPSTSLMTAWSAGWRNCTYMPMPTSWSCWWATRLTWSQRGLCRLRRPGALQVQRQQVRARYGHEKLNPNNECWIWKFLTPLKRVNRKTTVWNADFCTSKGDWVSEFAYQAHKTNSDLMSLQTWP